LSRFQNNQKKLSRFKCNFEFKSESCMLQLKISYTRPSFSRYDGYHTTIRSGSLGEDLWDLHLPIVPIIVVDVVAGCVVRIGTHDQFAEFSRWTIIDGNAIRSLETHQAAFRRTVCRRWNVNNVHETIAQTAFPIRPGSHLGSVLWLDLEDLRLESHGFWTSWLHLTWNFRDFKSRLRTLFI